MNQLKPENSMARLIGNILEAVREAVATIKNNKMRSGLVILGVMIGVTSLMGMVATVSGLQKFIQQTFSAKDTPILALSRIDFLGGGDIEKMQRRKQLEIDDVYALEKLPHIEGVMPKIGRPVDFKYKNKRTQLTTVMGTNEALLYVESLAVGEGRYMTETEMARRRNVTVLGPTLAKNLFENEDALDKYVRIGGKEYRVVGVMEKRKTIFGGFADNYAVIPYLSYKRDFETERDDMQFNIIVDDAANLDEAAGNVRSLMRMRRKVPVGQPDDFALIKVDDFVEFTEEITDQVALVLVVLASIALMIGGIGVMVIMLVSVTERTQEIGVRKAIGASRSQITWQFLIEAATLSGIGGLVGVLVGILLAMGISSLLGFPFLLPFGWVAFAVIVSLAVGLFFGIFPAHKAAKLDPIEALRYE